jgi:hypothetical protein
MLLNETTELKSPKLVKQDDAFRMKIPFLIPDVKNDNGHIYPKALIKRAVEKLKAKLGKRSTYGSNFHPAEISLDDVSHLIEDAEVDEKGVAFATVKVLPTQKGRNLSAIVNNGGSIGVSARGVGGEEKDGTIKDDYEILGIDFVLNPAFPLMVNKKAVFESKQIDDEAISLEQLEKLGLIEDGQAKVEGSILRQRYDNAVRLAGYKGDLESYRKLFKKGK